MLVDKTSFGSVPLITPTFIALGEKSKYWSFKRISVFLCFLLVSERLSSFGITVYNRTVTNTENTVWTVSNSFLSPLEKIP